MYQVTITKMERAWQEPEEQGDSYILKCQDGVGNVVEERVYNDLEFLFNHAKRFLTMYWRDIRDG